MMEQSAALLFALRQTRTPATTRSDARSGDQFGACFVFFSVSTFTSTFF
jgi:hypothetical protein